MPWDYLPAKHPEASFISNHCYRNTKGFRKGFELAMNWCSAQDWVPLEFATGNYPFYIAYAIKSSGGKVFALHEKDVLRGCLAEEAIYQEYADGGNLAFYHLLIYDTFANTALHADIQPFKAVRLKSKQVFLMGFLGILGNKKISINACRITMQHSGIKFTELFTKLFYNIRHLLRMIPWLRGYRLKKLAKSTILMQSDELFKNIRILSN